jgi:pimeloyl-ACP methyl ester carboxylesterase
VRRSLEHSGWRVFTPTLTGLGERAHLASTSVTLETHVADVLGVLEAEELSHVVLCGHSYGGMVITGVADRLPERISHLIYLDAIIPANGQSSFDAVHNNGSESYLKSEGSLSPLLHNAAGFGVHEPDDAAWVNRRMTRQPLETFTEKLRLTGGIEKITQRIFVRCSGYAGEFLDGQATSFDGQPGWRVDRWDGSGHDVMVTEPERVADLIRQTEIQ